MRVVRFFEDYTYVTTRSINVFFYKLVVLLLVLEKLFLICVVYSIHVALSLGSAGGCEPAAADMLPSLPSTCKEGG